MTTDLAPGSTAVDLLIDAARCGDARAFGAALERTLAEDTQRSARSALDALALAVQPHLAGLENPAEILRTIRDLVRSSQPACDRVMVVNAVVLEHLARATQALSNFAAITDPAFLGMYSALLAGCLPSRPAVMPSNDDPLLDAARADGSPAPEALVDAVAAAVVGVQSGDADAWRKAVDAIAESDLAAADLEARRNLQTRLDRAREIGDLDPDVLTDVVQLSLILAASVDGGPFAGPAYLFELVIRRALDETGCDAIDDLRQGLFATTEVSGLLDLRSAVGPLNWIRYAIDEPA